MQSMSFNQLMFPKEEGSGSMRKMSVRGREERREGERKEEWSWEWI